MSWWGKLFRRATTDFKHAINPDKPVLIGGGVAAKIEELFLFEEFEDGGYSTCSVLVEPTEDGLYRLLETPFLDPFETPRGTHGWFGDVIRVTPTEADKTGRRFVEVVRAGRFTRHEFILGEGFPESPDFDTFARKIVDAGGQWERVCGGFLLVHIPIDSHLDVERELTFHLRAWRSRDA